MSSERSGQEEAGAGGIIDYPSTLMSICKPATNSSRRRARPDHQTPAAARKTHKANRGQKQNRGWHRNAFHQTRGTGSRRTGPKINRHYKSKLLLTPDVYSSKSRTPRPARTSRACGRPYVSPLFSSADFPRPVRRTQQGRGHRPADHPRAQGGEQRARHHQVQLGSQKGRALITSRVLREF